jgi:glycosyltransferase involved in cell wall biosynthesis
MRRVLLVADHPALHRGFATVGRKIAAALHHSGVWDVHYLGRFADGQAAATFPYRVYASHLHDADDDLGRRTFPALAARLLRDLPEGQHALLVLVLGPVGDQAPLLRAALEAGVRARLHFAAYVAVDYVPLPRRRARFFRAIDTVIPYSAAGEQAIAACCRDDGAPLDQPLSPVPHGVDVSVFRPLEGRERAEARAAYYGAGDGDFVVGYFGRNSRHKRVDLALSIFRIFAHGLAAVCRRCERTSTFRFHPTTYEYAAVTRCRHCSSPDLDLAPPRPQAKLYVHAELLTDAELLVSGGWDLRELVRRMRLDDQVIFNDSLEVARGVPEGELAARMAACDVHLLPYEGGGWELTVLETGACGVPNIITDYATPPEYAAPFAECIAVAAYLARRRGEIFAIISEEQAVAALTRLAADGALRKRLGENGVRVASRHAWERLGEQWLQLLGDIDLSRPLDRPGLRALAPLLATRAPRTLS